MFVIYEHSGFKSVRDSQMTGLILIDFNCSYVRSSHYNKDCYGAVPRYNGKKASKN